jgi:hypothetical protein
MIRDTLKDKAYYDDYIKFSEETIADYIEDITNNGSLSIEVKMNISAGLVFEMLSLMHQRYSRGDNLLKLKANLVETLEFRQWQKKYADALPLKEQKFRIRKEEMRNDFLEKWLEWLAFSYCLNMGQDYYQQVIHLLGNQSQDALFDAIAIKMGDTFRNVTENLISKKRFNKLHSVILASENDRPTLMMNYLNAWYKLIGSPDFHLMDTDAYDGYWCWEAALVTKLYNIDDTIYLNHTYYPKDLVHWNGE